MILPKARRYLFDVNVLIALLDEDHVHHEVATQWFSTPGLQWTLCPFTEAGLLRYMTKSETGGLEMAEATALLANLAEEPGYHYQSVSADWCSLCQPFSKRVFGPNQVTDAFLLGMAIRDGLVLVTFDRAILHLAGEHRNHVHLLETK